MQPAVCCVCAVLYACLPARLWQAVSHSLAQCLWLPPNADPLACSMVSHAALSTRHQPAAAAACAAVRACPQLSFRTGGRDMWALLVAVVLSLVRLHDGCMLLEEMHAFVYSGQASSSGRQQLYRRSVCAYPTLPYPALSADGAAQAVLGDACIHAACPGTRFCSCLMPCNSHAVACCLEWLG